MYPGQGLDTDSLVRVIDVDEEKDDLADVSVD